MRDCQQPGGDSVCGLPPWKTHRPDSPVRGTATNTTYQAHPRTPKPSPEPADGVPHLSPAITRVSPLASTHLDHKNLTCENTPFLDQLDPTRHQLQPVPCSIAGNSFTGTTYQDPDQVRTNTASHWAIPPVAAGTKRARPCATSRPCNCCLPCRVTYCGAALRPMLRYRHLETTRERFATTRYAASANRALRGRLGPSRPT